LRCNSPSLHTPKIACAGLNSSTIFLFIRSIDAFINFIILKIFISRVAINITWYFND